SVGTSVVTTMIVRRSQFHQAVLETNTNWGNQGFRNLMNGFVRGLTHAGLGLHEAQSQALARIYAAVQAQAAALAYIDTYWVLGIAALVMFFLSFVLKKNDPRAKRGSVSAH